MQRIISESAFTASPAHPVQEYLIDVASGTVVTLPDALGTGFRYRFRIGARITSGSAIIQAASSADVFAGVVLAAADSDSSVNGWETAADSDRVSLNGSTRGGFQGDFIEFVDIKEGVWAVSGIIKQTGTEVTPFFAAV